MIIKMIREGLGRVIIFFDFITRPKKIVRSQEAQAAADERAQKLELYQFYACPFCVKVRRNIHRLNLNVGVRDAQNDDLSRKELLDGGGRIKVPCLRIQNGENTQWMYDSKAINQYLNESFESS